MPAAVPRLAALGVALDGHPLRGIRYLDAAHQADALFRRGDGLGVRRTVLHAALSDPAWHFTAGLLWSRNQPLLAPRIVPAAQRLPWLFSALVNHAASA